MSPETSTKLERFLLVLTPTVPALLAWFSSLSNKKKLQEIHVQFNSRFDQMIQAVKTTANAAGRKEQREEDQARANQTNPNP